MLMRMRLKQIHTDWPQVPARKQVSLSSPADHPTKQIAGQKTGGKRSARHVNHWGVHIKAYRCLTMSRHNKQFGPVIVCPNLRTGVNSPFAYDPNH
ncbi:hypothetical protein O181_045130 [Austropuccinia psidii MF-1]|uniref:Uncharacterized protein n=1 Tax=Austropuccinia psidii MF-1 TaxID=1389203 RepID=A0A9Q3DQT3_9BASI|nr:hypothetical protein [Austropuccinia psidii MF-1]